MGEFTLSLRRFPVRSIAFGPRTELVGAALTVSRTELTELVLADPRLASVAVDLAVPGDSCRILNVRDAIEPRTKIAGRGTVFPGFLGSGRTVGTGITHCLTGMALVLCAEPDTAGSSAGPAKLTAPWNMLIEMSGPAARLSPFSQTINLVLTCRPAGAVPPAEFDAACTLAGLKAADYLARASRETDPAGEDLCELTPATGLPRVVYILQAQNDGPFRNTYLYGETVTESTVPTILHPNELYDGALVNASGPAAASTYALQNNRVIQAMYRRHGSELDFAGVILGSRHWRTDAGKEQRAWFAAKLAKQLGADGAVLCQEGGGNSIIDQMFCCQACAALGIRTVVVSYEMGGADGTDFPLIFHVPEAEAVVSTGNREVVVDLPAVQRALGGERFLFSEIPATAAYQTPLLDMAWAIDQSGFWHLRAWDH